MYKVEGYEFETKEQAQAGLQEAEKIRYLRSKTSMDDPDVILTLYNRLVERKVFVTPVGLGYLLELRDYLNTVPYIKKEDILPIPIDESELEKKDKTPKKKAGKRREEKAPEPGRAKRGKERNYRRLFHISTFFAVVFAVAAMGMLAIAWFTMDNVNIFNYENALIDKYESWEKELDEREEQIKLREQELDIQEELE